MRGSTAFSLAAALMVVACKRQQPDPTPSQVVSNSITPDARAPSNAAQNAAGSSAPMPSANPCDQQLYRAPPGDAMRDLTQTSTTLLWREHRGIIAWPKPSGPERVLIANDRVKAMTADEQYVYFAQETGDRSGVFRVPIAGGEPERMGAIGGMFGLIDELKSTSTHVIMSRGMGELVRIAKQAPFAQQVYSRRDQRRNGFGAWAVSEHAAWFGRPSRGLNDAGWVRLDFETGALTTIEGPIVGIFASATTAVVVRGNATLRVTTSAQEREQKIFVVNEATGAVEATPWWTGEPGFGFAVGAQRIAFNTILESPANAMPVRGWMHGAVGAGPLQRFITCPSGTSMMTTPLASLFDGDAVYVVVSDSSNRHSLSRIQRQP